MEKTEDQDFKNKGGRPKKFHLQRAKKRVTFNCTTIEHHVLYAEAKSANISLSEYCRKILLGYKVTQPKQPYQLAEIRKLSAMSNNLNQLAKKANSGKDIESQLRETIEAIRGVLSDLKK